MKPSDVMYYNTSTGLCEPYNKNDMRFGKSLRIYGSEKQTVHIVNRLILEGFLDFKTRIRLWDYAAQPFYDLLVHRYYSPQDVVDLSLHIERTRMDDSNLEIEITEDNGTRKTIVGHITIRKNLKRSFRGYLCKGVSIIDPGNLNDRNRICSRLADDALSAVAMACAAYLLVMCDGDWESIGKGWKDTYTINKEKVGELEQQNSGLRQAIGEISEERNAANDLIEEAKAAESEASEKINRLQKENTDLQEKYDSSEQEKKKMSKIAEQKLEKRTKELAGIWEIYLCGPNHPHRMKYGQGFVKQVAGAHLNIQAAVQRKMIEIVDAQDPAAVSGNRGKIHGKDKQYHCKIQKSKGDRLHYTFDPKENCVTFVDFVSHDKQDKMI